MAIDVQEGRDLFRAAERDWEYHDYSKAFGDWATWCEDYFRELTDLALAAQAVYPAPLPKTCKEAGDRCKNECTIDMTTGKIADPDCFR